MRAAAIDLGSNSTRLLVADVTDDDLTEVRAFSRVTRMGEGVDRHGRFSPQALARVHQVLADYRAILDREGVTRAVAILTSAARDAADGRELAAELQRRYDVDARILTGEEEAQLVFAGAVAGSAAAATDGEIAVIDVGGGSTEIAVGDRDGLRAQVSVQAGVVRHTERFLHTDPPTDDEVAALRADVRAAIAAGTHAAGIGPRTPAIRALAVGGTPIMCAAMLGLGDGRGHGAFISDDDCERLLAELAALPLAERERVPGIDPARAPAIVAGLAIQLAAIEAIGSAGFIVSDHDLRHGALIELVRS